LLDTVADQGMEREAEKRRQIVGAMFRWALSQDIIETDPTAGLKAYDPGTPRDRVLTVEEIEALWKWLNSSALPPEPAEILKLQLLTGARCGEVSGLCAEEINCDEGTWTLPAARSKNKRPSLPARGSISIAKISGFWFRHPEVRILPPASPWFGFPVCEKLGYFRRIGL
jgi:integrase